MTPLPSALLPKVPGCHSLPDFESVELSTELMTNSLVKTGLYFHWLKRAKEVDPARISTEMPSAAGKIMTVCNRLLSTGTCGFPAYATSSEMTALFLLHLEERSVSKEALAAEFLSLDKETIDFLAHHVGRALQKPGDPLAAIQDNPFLLLQIQNDKNENILEVLLERLEQRDSIIAELERIKSLPVIDLESLNKSPCFGLFCWYVGNTDITHGETLLQNDPTLLLLRETELRETISTLEREGEAFTVKDSDPRDIPLMIEMAKLCAQQNPSVTAALIQYFGIDSKTPAGGAALIEIAKLCAQKAGAKTAAHIKKFGIDPTNQLALIEIAKLCARQNGFIAGYIQNFGIDPTNQAALIEIAKLCAQQSGEGTAGYIQNFGIDPTNQLALIEIAKLCAQKNDEGTAKYIKNFGIDSTNQAALIEIATLCAKQSGEGTAQYIKNFGIDPKTSAGQVALIEIAKLCAKQSGQGTAASIQNFGIDPTNQAALIEIAKLCAQQSGEGTAGYIQKFGIDPTNEPALIEIATLCAKQSGRTAEYIRNFGIDPRSEAGEEALIEIAKLCAQQSGRTAEYIRNFWIISREAVESITILCCLQSLLETSPLVRGIDVNLAKDLSVFYSETSPVLKFLVEEKKKSEEGGEDSPLILNYRLHYLMALYVGGESLRLRGPLGAGVAGGVGQVDKETEETLLKIFALRSRPIQIFLSFILSEVMGDPLLRRYFTSLVEGSGSGNKAIGYEYARPILLSVAYRLRGVEESSFPEVKKSIRAALTANKEKIKDGAKGLNITCLNTLKVLGASPLSPKDKLHLFTEVCRANPGKAEANNFEKSLKYLQLLCEMRFFSEKLPTELQGEFTFEQLQGISIEQAKAALFGKDETLDLTQLLAAKYLEVAEKQRRPLALELYAKKIRSLSNAGLNEALSRFFISVFKGTSQEVRYNATLSPHLQMMEKNFPSLWERWKSLLPPRELNATASRGAGVAAAAAVAPGEVASFHEKASYGWLREKLITDKHLGSVKLPLAMESFLSDERMLPDAAEIVKSLGKEEPYGKMQELCFQLCEKGISLEKTQVLLGELQKVVDEDSSIRDTQWKRDIDDRIKLLSTQEKEGVFNLVITDDWQDLFLCGTEVLGSCQNIDGGVELNKCLLGYCLDGKIQMLAVKDKAGKIVARALLKLLFTEQGGKQAPALFLERIYPDPSPHQKALNDLAMQRARDLGVALYTHSTDLPVDGGAVSLQSLGTSSPFEYEDGGVGVSNGVYTISNAHKVVL